MRPLCRITAFVLCAAALRTMAGGLPDTGQDSCWDASAADTVPPANAASIARDGGTYPRQDCRFGADPAAAVAVQSKAGGGAKGLDYTKIANNGSALPAGAAQGTGSTDWACTKDNTTGLTCEVKTAPGTDLRSVSNTFTWYDTNPATDGGNAGSTGTNTCNGTLPGNLCNTQAYVAAVNAAALCTYTDWRMPTRRELFGLLLLDGSNPMLDPGYFPNSGSNGGYWSATSNSQDATMAWIVGLSASGIPAVANTKASAASVRLVRGGSF